MVFLGVIVFWWVSLVCSGDATKCLWRNRMQNRVNKVLEERMWGWKRKWTFDDLGNSLTWAVLKVKFEFLLHECINWRVMSADGWSYDERMSPIITMSMSAISEQHIFVRSPDGNLESCAVSSFHFLFEFRCVYCSISSSFCHSMSMIINVAKRILSTDIVGMPTVI